jgi:hypothetical protein
VRYLQKFFLSALSWRSETKQFLTIPTIYIISQIFAD